MSDWAAVIVTAAVPAISTLACVFVLRVLEAQEKLVITDKPTPPAPLPCATARLVRR